MSMPRPLDLNLPNDARTYIAVWVSTGRVQLEDGDTAYGLTDQKALELAKLLFLKGDTREAPQAIQ